VPVAVERIERLGVALREDAFDPGDPVRALAVEEVPHDVDRTERGGTLVAAKPLVGEAAEERTQHARGALQDLEGGGEVAGHRRKRSVDTGILPLPPGGPESRSVGDPGARVAFHARLLL